MNSFSKWLTLYVSDITSVFIVLTPKRIITAGVDT